MLKHKEIIEKLSIKQKIALLTDIKCLSNPEYVALGIPYTSISTLEDMFLGVNEEINSNILARSWDTDAVKNITEELVSNEREKGINFVISPSPKMKLSPYVPAISEDPCLSGELVGAYLNAIREAGVPACVSGFGLDAEDVDYLDLEFSRRILYEYLIRPFKIAVQQGDCHSVMAAVNGPGNGYGDLNLKLMRSVKAGLFNANTNVLCNEHTPEATAEVWHAGGIVMAGVSSVLDQAYDKYNQIIRAMHEGHATVNDLEDAYADGSAISDEMIDAAVSKVIDFAFSCNKEYVEKIDIPEAADIEMESDVNNSLAEIAEEATEEVVEEATEGIVEEATEEVVEEETEEIVEEETEEIVEEATEEVVEEETEKVAEEETEKVAEKETEEIAEEVTEAVVEEAQTAANINYYASENLLRAIRESIVLLKNQRSILPLRAKRKIAVIGDAAISGDGGNFATSLIDKLDSKCIGTAKGYAMNNDKNESYLEEAKQLANMADVVLLFLCIDPKRREKLLVTKRLELPANQAALLEELKPYSNKIVAIIGGDVLPAASLDSSCAAMLLAPIGGENCVIALSDVLTGRYNPGGRLTESYFDDPCSYFENVKRNKDSKKNKIGPYMGYRHYDSSGESVRYPFGYGLSYTRFEYSGLSISDKRVSFYVKNVGNMKGTETVQLYVGKADSAYIRPRKELKAFRRLELNAGEKRHVDIEIDDLSIYDEKIEKFVTEQGAYNIFVGASVSDIRLTGQMNLTGPELKSDAQKTEREADYLQTKSNILLDKYTLEAKSQKMKRSIKWRIGYIIGSIITAIINAILIAARIYIGSNILILGNAVIAMLVVFDAFALSLIVLAIVMDAASIKKFRRLRSKEEKENLEAQFSDAKVIESMDIDELFIKEFDEIFNKKKDDKPMMGFDLSDYSRFVTDEMNFQVAQRTLIEAARRKGMVIDDEFSATFLSAFVGSRLLLLNSKEGKDIRRFTDVLSDFFGTAAHYEMADARFVDCDLLLKKNEDGSTERTSVMDMLSEAMDHKEKIYFAVVSELNSDLLSNLFSQYIRYLNNPERESRISLNEEKYTIPENVWFLVSMAEGENVQSIPVYLAELMMTVNVEYTDIPVVETAESEDDQATDVSREALPELMTLGYYQLSFMAEKCRHSFSMSEDLWKKVDRLEEYATKHSGYRFGNKLWLRFEKYLAVLKACEVEPSVALDNALNSILVHILQIALEGKIAEDDRGLLEVLEFYFGEDNVLVCRKTLKGVSISED